MRNNYGDDRKNFINLTEFYILNLKAIFVLLFSLEEYIYVKQEFGEYHTYLKTINYLEKKKSMEVEYQNFQ